MITVTTIKDSNYPCGFCTTGGRHDLCPGGVLNGDRVTLVRCKCPEHEPVTRCLECGQRGDEVSPETWICIDLDACEARKQKWAMDSIRTLYGDPETGEPMRAMPKAQQVKKPSRGTAKVGACLHCQEPTRGGLFLPGHDSKYLSSTVAAIKGGMVTLEKQLELWAERGISEALQGKLIKKVQEH